jgi:DNA-binding HxlR family transcriptional regulator
VARTKSENGRADVEVYALTQLGSDLRPTFKALGSFGELLIQKRVSGSN